MVYLEIAYRFVFKLFTFKKGSLLVGSSVVSTGFTYYFSMLFKGVDIRDLVLLIFIESVFVLLFMIFTLGEFVTGINTIIYLNSISENPKEKAVERDTLWATFWKTFGVIMVTVMLFFLAVIAILMKMHSSYWIFVWALVCFSTMACGFEFYSIGENIAKKNNGKKHRIFGFVDRILNAIQNKAISKIDNSFSSLEEPKKEEK